MSARPDELRQSPSLLGDNAYPESQVSSGSGTYWLERSADGVKRLVAVAEHESAFDGFEGTREPTDGGFRLASAIDPQPPPDWPTTMALPGAICFFFCMYSMTHSLRVAMASPGPRKFGLSQLPT